MSSPEDGPAEGLDADTKRWAVASEYLEPAKSTERLVANAKYVVTTVTVVAAILAITGTVTLDKLSANGAARVLLVVTALVTLAAVILAFASLISRTQSINVENLHEVRAWFEVQAEKGVVITAAGVAMILALLLAGATVLSAAFGSSDEPPLTQLSRSNHRGGDQVSLVVEARTPDVSFAVRLVGQGARDVVLFEAVLIPSSHGAARLDQTVAGAKAYSCLRLEVSYGRQTKVTRLGC